MTDEQTIAAEVRDFVLENLRTYTTRGDGAVEKILADFAPDLSFIPAVGENQNMQGIEEMEAFIRGEFEQHPFAIEIDVRWTKVKLLRASLAVVELAADLQFGETVAMELRSTFVCEKRQGRWGILHLHGSLPARPDPVELWPVDELRARNEALEREVAARTEELAAHNAALQRAHREAQIEAALERVRARSMAMHRSDELREVVAVLFEQIQPLGFESFGCTIVICDEAAGGMECWYSSDTQAVLPQSYHLPLLDHPVIENLWNTWKKKVPYLAYENTGDLKRSYDDLIFEQTEFKNVPEVLKAEIRAMDTVFGSYASMRHGLLATWGNLEPLSDDKAAILQRFARVFEQTYTRFLDLKKAEAQAREAQIEAALERVRARAMAMHRSDELREVVSKVFEEFRRLDFDAPACSIGIFDEATRASEWWTASTSNIILPRSYSIPYLEDWPHDWYQTVYNNWQQGVPFFTCSFEGEAKRAIDHKLISETEFGLIGDSSVDDIVPLESLILSYATLTHGVLEVGTTEPISEDLVHILQRFARVIDLTYTRVDDLQQAEARARDAVRQASLDRVRAEIASMRTANDLRRITPLLWRELTTLGVPFFRCGVFIIDEATEHLRAYLTNPQGQALAALSLPFDSAEMTQITVDHWRAQQVYSVVWEREAFLAWIQSMMAQGHIQPTELYEDPPEQLTLQFVPFTQGMLYIGSPEALSDEQVDLVQRLAATFAVAYARYEDFRQLEVTKAHVEKTLAELKVTQTQLIHSEKMASLGQMTAGIAHEIKNPLNFVNNFAEVNEELADEILDDLDGNPGLRVADIKDVLDDIKQNASHIARHGKRADAIVRAMMQHARGGSGTQEPTAINPLVEEYVNLAYHGMRASRPGFTVEIERAYGEEVGQAPVQGQDLGRVLLNLLGNAFDAVQQQQAPTVRVSTCEVEGQVKIRVSDNGSGIPAEIRDRIFEPFFTTKPTGAGTGLGLSLSYDIVTQGHGGTLTLESEEGRGTTFTITIPTSPSPAPSQTPAPSPP